VNQLNYELSRVAEVIRAFDPTQLNQLSWVESDRALWSRLKAHSTPPTRLHERDVGRPSFSPFHAEKNATRLTVISVYRSNCGSRDYKRHTYRVAHKKQTSKQDRDNVYNAYTTHVLKISVTYLQNLKQSKCCSICPLSTCPAITETSRFRNCVIARSIKSVRRKHVYLWHHKWRHKEYLTGTIFQRILIRYRPGGYLWHETVVEQQFT